MKKHLLIYLILFTLKITAQDIVMPMNEEQKICFSGVVDIPEKSQQKLYSAAKEYILLNYTARDFPTILDEVNERIYVKGTFKAHLRKYAFPIFFHSTVYDLIYTYKIYFKDNKYKYEITDMILTRKTNAKIKGYYWGNGISSASIKDGEVIKTDLEKMYKVKRYRQKWNKLFFMVETEVSNEVARFNKALQKEDKSKDW
jgi:hypothetical protein